MNQMISRALILGLPQPNTACHKLLWSIVSLQLTGCTIKLCVGPGHHDLHMSRQYTRNHTFFKRTHWWCTLCRSAGWAQQLQETVRAFKKRHPGASAERGREGILAAARQRLPNDIIPSSIRTLQRKFGIDEDV